MKRVVTRTHLLRDSDLNVQHAHKDGTKCWWNCRFPHGGHEVRHSLKNAQKLSYCEGSHYTVNETHPTHMAGIHVLHGSCKIV